MQDAGFLAYYHLTGEQPVDLTTIRERLMPGTTQVRAQNHEANCTLECSREVAQRTSLIDGNETGYYEPGFKSAGFMSYPAKCLYQTPESKGQARLY